MTAASAAGAGAVLALVALGLGACATGSDSGEDTAPGFRPAAIDPTPLWDFADPAASEAVFAARVAEAEAEEAVLWRTQVARAMGLAGDFDRARALLDELEAGLAGGAQGWLSAEASEAHVRVALERGRVENSNGLVHVALPYFERAWSTASRLRLDGLAVDAAHMAAIAADGDEALRWNALALELATTSEDPTARAWIASLENNEGWIRFERGELDVALVHFERALTARKQLGDARRTRIADWAIARCLRELGRLDEALEIQERLARELAAAGETDVFVEEELGELQRALGRGEE